MNNQVLSIEQMQELIELGIDTSNASAFYYPNYGDYYKHPITKKYVHDIKGYNPYPSFVNGNRTLKDLNPDLFPTFTLQDILKILPRTINYDGSKRLRVLPPNELEYTNYSLEGHFKHENSLLEAAFSMLKWVKQNGYI